MKSIRTRVIIGLSTALFLTAFSAPAHSQTQEQLGKAIQEAAVLSQQHDSDRGLAQERLGRAIQETAQTSGRVASKDGKFQEQLGKEIQESAIYQYAHGLTQEKMGGTIVQMARS